MTNTSSDRCRFCGDALVHTFVDLGMSPLSESYVSADQLNAMEPFYPLHVYVCGRCFLVQLQEYVRAEEIFREYAYFSSYSDTWVEHARLYAEHMISRFALHQTSGIVEIGSNDGYLLRHFVARGLNVLGIEPAANVAEAAARQGIPTRVDFFGGRLARELVAEGIRPRLLIGNNVLAQVPDLNDFVAGIPPAACRRWRGHDGVSAPVAADARQPVRHHLSRALLVFFISHGGIHFAAHGLVLFDVEELPTHGGSLRIYGRHREDVAKTVTGRVTALRAREAQEGVTRLDWYGAFAEQVKLTKWKLLAFLSSVKQAGKSIAGYGAPGKGNTLLNYCGIRTDLVDYTVDRNVYKQGKVHSRHAHSYLRAREDLRDQAGLSAGASLERQGRDRPSDERHPIVGRTVHHPHSGSARRLLARLRHRPDSELGDLGCPRQYERMNDDRRDVGRLNERPTIVVTSFGLMNGCLHRSSRPPEKHAEHSHPVLVHFVAQAVGNGSQGMLGRRILRQSLSRDQPRH